ncbi:MAG TPA: polyphosphate kinase 2 family protein [Gemmatimonadales bacterium]|nr:polyphosphate kinase 2 family protein [Gemmatimonadales bacterium]
MHIDPAPFLIKEGQRVKLASHATRTPPYYGSKDDYKSILDHHGERLSDLQQRLYSTDRYALLVILQGMDASGKDGAIGHVMSGVNPQGCEVTSFKQPSPRELAHDFLWRAAARLPARGRIGIFNRSYYEEVLVVRVHPELLRQESVADRTPPQHVWTERYRSIVGFEHHLHRNATRLVKIFLHISREEQRKRLLARIEEPHKNWKFNIDDVRERRLWSRYMRAYAACLEATSTARAPWYVVPGDDKLNARLIVSQIIIDALDGLNLRFAKVSPARKRELNAMRRLLERK